MNDVNDRWMERHKDQINDGQMDSGSNSHIIHGMSLGRCYNLKGIR